MGDYREIGDAFTIGNDSYIAVDDAGVGGCGVCAMARSYRCLGLECTRAERRDDTAVHFTRLAPDPTEDNVEAAVTAVAAAIEESAALRAENLAGDEYLEPAAGSIVTLENGARLRVDLDNTHETCERCDLQEYGGNCDEHCDNRSDGTGVHFVYLDGYGTSDRLPDQYDVPPARNTTPNSTFRNIRSKDG